MNDIKQIMNMYLKGETKTEVISLKASRPISVEDIDTVPVGNKSTFKILKGDDEDPAEFITEVKLGEDYPARPWSDTELILTEKWAKSFAKAINENAKPLYRKGHEDAGINSKMRAIPIGYVVGAIVKDGSLFLRNYYRQGETAEQIADRNQDMTELKAGILSTSTGDQTEYTVDYNEETKEYTYKAEKSLGGQSNAIVEAHMTGAEAEVTTTTFKDGNVDNENKEQEYFNMDKEIVEMLSRLKNLSDKGTVSMKDIEEGLDVIVLKKEDTDNLNRLKAAEEVIGDITKYVEKVQSDKVEAFAGLKENALKDTFADEGIRKAAERFFTLKEGSKEEVEAHVAEIAEIEALKEIVSLKASVINHQPGANGSASKRKGPMNA
jgi:hypothetical protein